MKTILVCNQKGGVGKTTIADEIAWSFERVGIPCNFYDLDGQGGVLHPTKEVEDAKVAVVDTPGALQPDMYKWIDAADLIVVPTRVGQKEVDPILTMVNLVNESGKPVIYVLNEWNRFNSAAGFEEGFRQIVGKKAKVYKVPHSEDFMKAASREISVVKFAKWSKSARAIKDLCNEIKRVLKIKEKE